jgi:hypothetical protein
MEGTLRTFAHFSEVRKDLLTQAQLCHASPEKAALAVAFSVFMEICDESMKKDGIAQINIEEALKILTSRLSKGAFEDLSPIEEIYVRGQLNMAMGYCEVLHYHMRLAAR